MQYLIIENGNFMRFLPQFDKTPFSKLIAWDKFSKNAIKSRNAKIIAHALIHALISRHGFSGYRASLDYQWIGDSQFSLLQNPDILKSGFYCILFGQTLSVTNCLFF